jgi:hypothetical protein
LVHSTNLVITSAHSFRYGDNRERQADPRKGFTFTIKVWSPKTKGYVFRDFRVKEVFFGTDDPRRYPHLDYAFVRLEEHVGEVVDGLPVPKKYQIRALPFRIVDKSKAPNVAMTAGYNKEINDFSKNCAPFSLTTATNDGRLEEDRIDSPESFYFHNGDTLGGASGSAIALPDEFGKPYYAALHKGWDDGGNLGRSRSGARESQAENSEDASGRSARRNIAINASTFYKSFMEFAQQEAR